MNAVGQVAVTSASASSAGASGGTAQSSGDEIPGLDPTAPGYGVDGSAAPAAGTATFQGALNKAAGVAAPTAAVSAMAAPIPAGNPAGVIADAPVLSSQTPLSDAAVDPAILMIQAGTAASAPPPSTMLTAPVATTVPATTVPATSAPATTANIAGGTTRKASPGRPDALDEALALALVAIPALPWATQILAPVASDAMAAGALNAAAAPSAGQADSTAGTAGGTGAWLDPAAATPLPAINSASELLATNAGRDRVRWRDAALPKLPITAAAGITNATVTASPDGNALAATTLRAAIAVNSLSSTLLPVHDRGDTSTLQQDPPSDSGVSGAANTWGLAAPSVQAANPAADMTTRTIELPVQHPRWATAVAAEVRWFAEQGVQGATLRLTPEHLGPVEVRLNLSDGQVNVNFSAAHADTRTALEQSIPQLREMLAGAGLSLGEAQVQQQARQGSQNSFNVRTLAADNEVPESSSRLTTRLGLVDEFA